MLGADTALDVPVVASHEEYFAALPSRRKTRLRKEKAQYVEQGLRTVVRSGRNAVTDDLVVLQAQLRAKHGMSGDLEQVRKEFFDIRDTVGDSVVVVSAERDGEVVGFTLCLYDKDRNELYARSSGFDHDAPGLYFALVYQEIPAWAADHGIRRIYFGTSTYEAKRARGCAMLPLYGQLRFTAEGGELLHRATALQALGETRGLEALGATVID
ncbi:GNAT family N-acetyltransferase [Amycolatopsis sulphurea]|uniref:GNAT family N-acetyltransferase n=1 Tax=Amycolatopsis sulphurea TaxID=76022 RepID=UPI001475D8B8|nr:GNAT family N-acetyltransferase [Amycolatopsis sulphurea]